MAKFELGRFMRKDVICFVLSVARRVSEGSLKGIEPPALRFYTVLVSCGKIDVASGHIVISCAKCPASRIRNEDFKILRSALWWME